VAEVLRRLYADEPRARAMKVEVDGRPADATSLQDLMDTRRANGIRGLLCSISAWFTDISLRIKPTVNNVKLFANPPIVQRRGFRRSATNKYRRLKFDLSIEIDGASLRTTLTWCGREVCSTDRFSDQPRRERLNVSKRTGDPEEDGAYIASFLSDILDDSLVLLRYVVFGEIGEYHSAHVGPLSVSCLLDLKNGQRRTTQWDPDIRYAAEGHLYSWSGTADAEAIVPRYNTCVPYSCEFSEPPTFCIPPLSDRTLEVPIPVDVRNNVVGLLQLIHSGDRTNKYRASDTSAPVFVRALSLWLEERYFPGPNFDGCFTVAELRALARFHGHIGQWMDRFEGAGEDLNDLIENQAWPALAAEARMALIVLKDR
jgi:hypothetical protein